MKDRKFVLFVFWVILVVNIKDFKHIRLVTVENYFIHKDLVYGYVCYLYLQKELIL